jgi:hypothetical protein
LFDGAKEYVFKIPLLTNRKLPRKTIRATPNERVVLIAI